jgi:hypothetical protein
VSAERERTPVEVEEVLAAVERLAGAVSARRRWSYRSAGRGARDDAVTRGGDRELGLS